MVNDKTNINVHRSNGNVVLEKNAQSVVDRKENQFRNSKYSRSTRILISNVKRRQAEFLGHVMRKGKLGIAAWLGRSTAEMFVDARDREKWKVMIAYACNRHGN